MCCFCVAELSYLSPSLCWSLHCGLHSWSKAGHSVCWHQLPWQGLKGVNKHCVSKADEKKIWREKNQLTEALVVLITQTVTRCTHKWDMRCVSGVAWQDNPGERGKCANWATMSAAHVSVWPLHLWEQVGVARGQQRELGAHPRSEVPSYTPHWLQQHPHGPNRGFKMSTQWYCTASSRSPWTPFQ